MQSWLELSKILLPEPIYPEPHSRVPLSFASPDPHVACSYLPGKGIQNRQPPTYTNPDLFSVKLQPERWLCATRARVAETVSSLEDFTGENRHGHSAV